MKLGVERGYTKAQARGHARVLKGELGIKDLRDAIVDALMSHSHRQRRSIRRKLLERFRVRYFETVDKFRSKRKHQEHKNRYSPIAEALFDELEVPDHEAYTLMFSP